jgi:uncharacterized protein YpmS
LKYDLIIFCRKIEQVLLIINVPALNPTVMNDIGDVEFSLTSPSLTTIKIAPATNTLDRLSNLNDYPLLCVGFWGESPVGNWTLQMVNKFNTIPRYINTTPAPQKAMSTFNVLSVCSLTCILILKRHTMHN